MSTPVVQGAEGAALDVRWVREQFPALQTQVNGSAAAFLDGPAGTQVPQQVIAAIRDYLVNSNANSWQTPRRCWRCCSPDNPG